MNKLRSVAAALLFTLSVVSSSYAIAGAGFHWGFDLSLSMDDVSNEAVNINNPNIGGGADIFKVSRENWKASAINFGGKAFIDIVPFLDIVEVSCNFGIWQYDGSLSYIDLESVAGGAPTYTVVPLGLKAVDLGYFGMSGTPYAKLQLDATIRKKVFALPLNIFKLSAGAGVSMHMASPLLTGEFVEGVFGSVAGLDQAQLETFFANLAKPGSSDNKKIVQKILDETLDNTVFGMHIVVGASAKLPVIPVGVYVDGKYMIPFGKFDKGKYIDGFGFLVNAGLQFSI